VPTVLKSGGLNLLEPSGTIQACNGIAIPLPLLDVTLKWYSLEKVCVFVSATTDISAPLITKVDKFYCFYEAILDMYWESLEVKAALKFTSGHTVLTLHSDRCL